MRNQNTTFSCRQYISHRHEFVLWVGSMNQALSFLYAVSLSIHYNAYTS